MRATLRASNANSHAQQRVLDADDTSSFPAPSSPMRGHPSGGGVASRRSLQQLRRDLKIPTRAQSKAVEEEATVKFREITLYAVFVALFTFTTLLKRNDQEMYFFTEAVRNQLTDVEFPAMFVPNVQKTFDDCATVEEFYQWMQGPFYSALWTASTFDGDHTFWANGVPATSTSTPNKRGYIQTYARLLGGVRIGWTRVPETTCALPEQFDTSSTEDQFQCSSPYAANEGNFRRGPLGTPNIIQGVQTITDTRSEPEVTSPTTADAYYAPSEYVILPNVEDSNNATVWPKLKELVDNHFFDRTTRIVTIDLTVHNANLDFTSIVRLMAEMPMAGGVVATSKFSTLRLYRYYVVSDFIRFLGEVMLYCIVVFYSAEVVRNVRRDGFKRHLGFANGPHNLNLLLFYLSLCFRIIAYVERPKVVKPSTDEFINFRQTANFLELAQDCNAFNAFLTWVKVTKYLSFVPKFKILLGTLQKAASEVWAFAIICCFVLFGSSQAFTLAFSTNIYGYRNLTQSFYTLTRSLLGDFAFEELRIHKPFLGPLMFFMFVALAVFVLLNMFIAIISDAFNDTKAELEKPENVAAAVELARAFGNVALRLVFKLPVVGSRCYNRLNNLGNAMEPGELNVRELFRLMDLNMYEIGLEKLISNSMHNVEDLMTIATSDVVDALLDMGADAPSARSLADELDVNGDGTVSSVEIEALLVKWEHEIRENISMKAQLKHAFHQAHLGKSSSRVGVEPMHSGSEAGMPKTPPEAEQDTTLVDVDAVTPRQEKTVEKKSSGVFSGGKRHATPVGEDEHKAAFVHALTASRVGPSIEVGNMRMEDVRTIRKAFNHLRLRIMIEKWQDRAIATANNTFIDGDEDAKRFATMRERRASVASGSATAARASRAEAVAAATMASGGAAPPIAGAGSIGGSANSLAGDAARLDALFKAIDSIRVGQEKLAIAVKELQDSVDGPSLVGE